MDKNIIWGLFLMISYTICSCHHNAKVDKAIYATNISKSLDTITIGNWNVSGAYSFAEDSLITKSVLKGDFNIIDNTSTTHINSQYHFHGYYHSKFYNFDLKEVFNINREDTTRYLDSLTTYLSCTIKMERTKDYVIYLQTKMRHTIFLNGDSIKPLDIKNILFYPIRLKEGDNILIVKLRGNGSDYSVKTIVVDPITASHIYAEQHSGDIIYPILDHDSIILTDAHWKITSQPIHIMIHNVFGKKVFDTIIEKGKISYPINGLIENTSYICTMVLAKDTIRQPILYGTMNGAEEKFQKLRKTMHEKHPRRDEADQLLYRVWKLQTIKGKMREEKWFPYKFPWVTYQLEHVFAYSNVKDGSKNENNIRFVTYTSPLDGGLQRYILATPNHIKPTKKYPLIIIMRPENEKHYHLFFCPQIAHQYVVNDLQMKAEKYQCFIAMPEARMLLAEDLIPFADAEMGYFMEHLQKHYNIDNDMIYLNANCTGGYRALKYAGMHPDIFAAMSLYAPIYSMEGNTAYSQTNKPQDLLKNLKTVPIFVHGDPADFHSSIELYKQLINDCKELGIPYTFSLKRNTGQGQYGYHRMLIGDEACQFFLSQNKQHRKKQSFSIPKKKSEIVDFYAQPFVYIYNTKDCGHLYQQLVDSIQKEYEVHLYSKLPLIPDTDVTEQLLHGKNIFLIGENFTNPLVRQFVKTLKQQNAMKPLDCISLRTLPHPYTKGKMVLLYTCTHHKQFIHSINYPWIYGFSDVMTR